MSDKLFIANAMIIRKCTPDEYPLLAEVWERSVRATHTFLSEETISEIKDELIPSYFPMVEIHVAVDDSLVMGFIGVAKDRIEMLFVDSCCQGSGVGSALIEFAIGQGAVKVDVNEQNPQARKFYESKGFRVIGRDETDDAGRPYPILHLSL